MLLHKPDLHGPQEVPIQSRVHEQDQDFRNLVPDVIDIDEYLANRRYCVCRDPDTEDSDVDSGDDDYGAPFDIADCAAVFSNKGDTIDDDLHKELDLEDPEEEDEE